LLQPIIFVDSPEKAVAYFRQARSAGPPRIASALTDNAGQSWVSGPDLDLANPNAAIAGLQLSNGDRLIALNDLESARHRLVLALKPAGTSNWNVITEVESDQTMTNGLYREFSYPSLLLGANGEVTLHESLRIGQRVRDVRQGPDGLVYVLTDEIHGRVFRLEPGT
jgi:hypothetical protein